MSHPVCRGTGLYSAHERECFEKEKQKYSFFFTTAGQVTGGAVGKVRMKLGYVPFDDWANYTLWLRTGTLREELTRDRRRQGPGSGRRWRPRRAACSPPACRPTATCAGAAPAATAVALHRAADAPLEEIARLWERNRERYGISVDRSAGYLKWRINDDPHLEHEYVTMYGRGRSSRVRRSSSSRATRCTSSTSSWTARAPTCSATCSPR